jgi:hypothetical protein
MFSFMLSKLAHMLMFQTCIWEAPDSHLSQETGYPD